MDNPTSRPLTWDIYQSSYSYGDGGNFTGTTSVTCPPGANKSQTLLFPVGSPAPGNWQRDAYLTLNVSRAGISTGGAMGNAYGSADDGKARVLLGRDMNAFSGNFKGSATSTFDTRLAPTDWRAYAGFQSLVVTGAEWTRMAPGARNAILLWVKSGGGLVAALDANTDRASLGLPEPDITTDRTALGLGDVVLINAPANGVYSKADKEFAGKLEAAIGWFSRDLPAQAIDGRTIRNWQDHDPELHKNTRGKGVGYLMLGVLVLFALIIGPVNLFIIAPSARRHRLFFSVPAISLIAVALLVASVLLGDGVGGAGTRHVLIENRPGDGENTNHLLQYQFSRCGALFSTGFTTPGQAVIQPLVTPNQPSGLSGSFSLRADASQLAAGGPWFASRTTQAYMMTAIEPTRGRIELNGTGASATVTSTFDFPIDSLFFTDGQAWWKATPHAQGTAAAVAPSSRSEAMAAIDKQTEKAPAEFRPLLHSLADRPLHFVAFSQNPAAIPSHKSIRWTTHGYITGPLVRPSRK